MRRTVYRSTAILVFGMCSFLQAQTQQYLDAPVVGPQIRVRWNTATKSMEWAPGITEDYSDIGTDALFLAKVRSQSYTKSSTHSRFKLLPPLRLQRIRPMQL